MSEWDEDEWTEEEIAKAKEQVRSYDEGITRIDTCISDFHREHLSTSEAERASVVNAWVLVVATTGFDEDGNSRHGTHVLGPRNIANWQDVGLLKIGLQTVLDVH